MNEMFGTIVTIVGNSMNEMTNILLESNKRNERYDLMFAEMQQETKVNKKGTYV
jgi:hypothetical protein